MTWKKKEAHLKPEYAALHYFRDSQLTWVEIPESRWVYCESGASAVFAPKGPYLRSLGKRLPPRRQITVSADSLIVHMLEFKYFYLLASLAEYVEDLQKNKREKGYFDVEGTPHIFE